MYEGVVTLLLASKFDVADPVARLMRILRDDGAVNRLLAVKFDVDIKTRLLLLLGWMEAILRMDAGLDIPLRRFLLILC